MKRLVLVVLSLLFVFAAASAVLAAKTAKGVFDAKTGDTIYVCGCGAGCDCGTLAKKEGKCGCGKELVKTTVTKVEDGKIYYQLDGKELSNPAKGKYFCNCKGCDCGTVSQKPGKCGCGQKLVKVKK
jgi:hypothetical protein